MIVLNTSGNAAVLQPALKMSKSRQTLLEPISKEMVTYAIQKIVQTSLASRCSPGKTYLSPLSPLTKQSPSVAAACSPSTGSVQTSPNSKSIANSPTASPLAAKTKDGSFKLDGESAIVIPPLIKMDQSQHNDDSVEKELNALNTSIVEYCTLINRHITDSRFMNHLQRSKRRYKAHKSDLRDLVHRILIHKSDENLVTQKAWTAISYTYLFKKEGSKIVHMLDISNAKYINAGAFCQAYAVHDIVMDRIFCLKTVRKDLNTDEQRNVARSLVSEDKMLEHLNRNGKVVGIQRKAVWTIKTAFGTFSLLYQKYICNLEYLLNKKQLNSVALKRTICLQLLSAISHLFLENIIHGDIKPSNILYRKLDTFNVFDLCDFAGAKLFSAPYTTSDVNTQGYTLKSDINLLYRAQTDKNEAIHAHVQSRRDIYAGAIVVIEVLTGVFPLDSNFNLKSSALNSTKLSESERKLLNAMVHKDPFKRISPPDALKTARTIWS